jgi:hypothetical protein
VISARRWCEQQEDEVDRLSSASKSIGAAAGRKTKE